MNDVKPKKLRTRAAGWLFGLMAIVTVTGCGPGDGAPVALVLPTDTLLNLRCAEVGIHDETCVLIDDENPFRFVAVAEFDVNLEMQGLPQPSNFKFNLVQDIPPGPTGAKARFYLWATALAKAPYSGENQWYTARALHEVFNANADPVIQAQAIKAYRSVLDNYFGTVTFFGPFGNPPVSISVQLNLLVGDDLYRPAATGFTPLFATPLAAQGAIASWGFTYIPCTITCPDDGMLFVNVP
jgi:hypothetical protein